MMRIEAELDFVHAKRLAHLQEKLQKPLSDVLADAIDLALAKLDQSIPVKSPIWEARARFEREHGALNEEVELPPAEITEVTWRNPLDE